MIALQKALARLRSFRVYRALALALARFDEIDGEQRAAAFGFYAFFSLFPLIVLLVTVWSFVLDRSEAITMILEYVRLQLPLTESHHEQLIQVLTGVINGRGQASIFALLVLLWGSMRFFHVLVRGVNCAWGTREYSWWRLPLQNLLMLGIVASALVLGIFGPVALEVVRSMFPGDSWLESLAFDAGLFLLPFVVLFLGLSLL